jgi:Family of unknown function (DUF6454)
MKTNRRFVTSAFAAMLAVAALVPAASSALASPATHDSTLADDLRVVDRTTAWTQLSALKLNFPTYHPEGLVVTPDRFYLSSTQIIEPTVKYPVPVDGYDRTPGKGVGHLFFIDRAGKLIKDVILGQDIVYHPGGIDLSGDDLSNHQTGGQGPRRRSFSEPAASAWRWLRGRSGPPSAHVSSGSHHPSGSAGDDTSR